MQAERVRVPYGNVGLVKIPANVTDDQAIMLSDIFPTGYFGTDLAEIRPGDTVAIFGCGPVGQFAIISAFLKDAGRVLAIDAVPSRLEVARRLGAEAIDYNQEDPVLTIMELTGGIGVDRAIDAVGVDANMPTSGPAGKRAKPWAKKFEDQLKEIAPKAKPRNGNWHPGSGPSQVLLWATESLAKAGTLAIIGVYPQTATMFPIGEAVNKNLTVKMGNCNHRRYIPTLLRYVQSGIVDPSKIVTQKESFGNAIDAYKAFDKRESQWIKVELAPLQK
jgi:threonine dehydrogenase-like Zn-dependent dehydrogenase